MQDRGDAAALLYICPTCGRSGAIRGLPFPPQISCPHCRAPLTLAAAGAPQAGEPPRFCPLCGDDKLYQKKDFSQKMGCLIFAVGAALVPWTWGLSLPVFALADLILYKVLPTITCCYVCGARLRGLPLSPEHHAFELLAAQTWEARALAWRRRHDAAPPPGTD